MAKSMTGVIEQGPRRETLTRRSLLGWAWGIFGVLLLENVLGMGLNLYVTLPSTVTFTRLFVYTPLLTAHIAIAFVLFGSAVYLLLLARRSRIVGLPWRSAALVLSLVLAIQEGFTFTFTQNNAFSYGMEIGFLGAVAFQASILFLLGKSLPAHADSAGVAGSGGAQARGGPKEAASDLGRSIRGSTVGGPALDTLP
ncbi:MAG: hypothetical protein ACREEC_03710 [Thermoplasmata archaeon]